MNLNSIIAKILKINVRDFETLVNVRGMRPVKAAIRLGAEPEKAQIFAGLKLATTASEIDAVYANENVRSCQTGNAPGQFYSDNGIGVIYSNNYRCLVNPKTNSLAIRHGWSGYGYHRDVISPVLLQYISGKKFWNKTTTCEMVEYGTGRFHYKPSVNAHIYGWKIVGVGGYCEDNTKRFSYSHFTWGLSIRMNLWTLGEYNKVLNYLEHYLSFVEKSMNSVIKVDLPIELLGKASSITITLKCVKEKENAYSLYCDYESRYKRCGYYHDLARKGQSGMFEENTEHLMKIYGYFKATFILDVKAIKTEKRKTKIKYYSQDVIIRNKGIFIPFLDIEESKKELPDTLFVIGGGEDYIEDYYLGRLGDSYKERMNHPRRNLSHGRKSVA